MRKIILNVAVSLDGMIEGPEGEIDWCFTDQDYGFSSFLDRIDAIIMGRKSYEVLLKLDPKAFPGKTIYVVSSQLEEISRPNTIVVKGNLPEAINKIRSGDGKDIWLFGGAQLVTAFINMGLLNELQLAIHPIILGAGKPLFTDIMARTNLKLLESRSYDSGMVQSVYEIKD